MKRMKKILASLLASTMIFGMAVTANAATSTVSPYKANITVKGFAENESTTVRVCCAIKLNDKKNKWEVSNWASSYIELDAANKTYKITDKAGLMGAAATAETVASETVTGTEKTFENLEVGAYVIYASGSKSTYTCLVAETYKQDELYMTAEDVTVTTKASGYSVDKEVNDTFVHVGQVLDFDVTTTFPSFETINENSTYVITDTPTNLNIDVNTVNVTLGGAPLTAGIDYVKSVNDETGVLTVDLSKSIEENNTNAGKEVVVTYNATVTGATEIEDYSFYNLVVAKRDDEEMGKDFTKGYTGDILIKKTDDSENPVVLDGAEFRVYQNYDKKEGATNTTLKFKAVADQTAADGKTIKVYKLDPTGNETIVAAKGYVKVIGLEEGTYWFEETKAPQGYSITETGVTVTIEELVDDPDTEGVDESIATAHIHKDGSLKNTKLIALPSTGGIGTTIFTVAGCAIMIAAAACMFAGRKKED